MNFAGWTALLQILEAGHQEQRRTWGEEGPQQPVGPCPPLGLCLNRKNSI